MHSKVKLFDINGQAWLEGHDGKLRHTFFPPSSSTFRTIVSLFDSGDLGPHCTVVFEKDDPKFKKRADGKHRVAMQIILARGFSYIEYECCIVVWFINQRPSLRPYSPPYTWTQQAKLNR